MSYRDDRDAWRDKAERLEQELEQTRRQLQEMTVGSAPRDETSHAPSSAALSRSAAWPILALLTLLATATTVMVVAPGEAMTPPVVGAVVLLVAMVGMVLVMSRFVEVIGPNRALVLGGRKSRRPDGSVAGFRIVGCGRAVRVPLIEDATFLDLELNRVVIRAKGMYARGGHKLDVELASWVAVDDASPGIDAAAERFLGMPNDKIADIARQTIEGALRAVVAETTPEQLVEDRFAVRDQLRDAAEDDLRKLGLKLESVCILSIADEAGYLAQLGRKRIATVLRDAEIRKAERA